ncbi:MAG: hypothetical protein GXP42_02555 [Chloroflexi bacterium]|nr:hypothetical protein [Chloroflexota bacterium]
MDQTAYRQWWQLHLRVARGEKLDSQEQQAYESGLEMLDREEQEALAPADLALLRQLRSQIDRMQTMHAQLLMKSAQLDEQIAALERAYQSLTGQTMLGERYASSQV